MVVKRIEHKVSKCGPYNGSLFGRRLDSWSLPTPSCDGIRWFPQNYLFAFYNDTLDYWVSQGDKILLALHGFVVRHYEVSEFIEGNNQVAFNPRSATMLREERLY